MKCPTHVQLDISVRMISFETFFKRFRLIGKAQVGSLGGHRGWLRGHDEVSSRWSMRSGTRRSPPAAAGPQVAECWKYARGYRSLTCISPYRLSATPCSAHVLPARLTWRVSRADGRRCVAVFLTGCRGGPPRAPTNRAHPGRRRAAGNARWLDYRQRWSTAPTWPERVRRERWRVRLRRRWASR